jgi:uncharacterized protein (TIGR00251 family)
VASDELRRRLAQAGQLSLAVKVIPKASRTEFAGVMADGAFKVKVAASPDKGKANAALCEFLEKELHAAIAVIVAGQTSQRKVVRLYSTTERMP